MCIRDRFNALWEEMFHTVTEGFNRYHSDWGFSPESFLGGCMQRDIRAKQYDFEVLKRKHAGHYDWELAVNEYIHQVWLAHLLGLSHVLTNNQRQVIQLMQATPGFPMHINPVYPFAAAQRIK